VPLALWATIAGAEEETPLVAAEEALGVHLLTASENGADAHFAHALIREALYAGLLPPRRRAWHRRVADALLELGQPDPDTVAYHLQHAADPRTATWLIRAGERARRAYALALIAAERSEVALPLLEAQGSDRRERAALLHLRWWGDGE